MCWAKRVAAEATEELRRKAECRGQSAERDEEVARLRDVWNGELQETSERFPARRDSKPINAERPGDDPEADREFENAHYTAWRQRR
jgi:hypothetical protein